MSHRNKMISFFGEGNFMRIKLFCAVLFASLLLITFCTEKHPQRGQQFDFAEGNGCIACHTNADLLKQVAKPLPPMPGEAGEG